MAKATGGKPPAPPVVLNSDAYMPVYFSREVIEERETFRRLAHRAVDLRIERGLGKWLHETVGKSLAHIARDHVIKMVKDSVHEVRAEQKETRR